MIAGLHGLVLVASLLIATTTAIAAADPDASGIRVEIHGDTLTLEARDVPLPAVLERIGSLAGIRFIQLAPADAIPRVTESFSSVPVREAVERLLLGTNRVIVYNTGGESGRPPSISAVWLLGPGEGPQIDISGAVTDGSAYTDAKLRSEELLRQSAASLGPDGTGDPGVALQALQEDPDALVRSRAAIALGALGDPSAVPALESALLDESFSVRVQAITALGEIGGERATEILGNILLYGSDTTQRVIAAQALWKQDTDAAREFLQLAASDPNSQVRSSSAAPAVTTAEPAAAGTQVTE